MASALKISISLLIFFLFFLISFESILKKFILQIIFLSIALPTSRGNSPTGPQIISIEPNDFYTDYIELYESDMVEITWQVIKGSKVSLFVNHKISEDNYAHLVLAMGTDSGSVEKVVKVTGIYTILIQTGILSSKTTLLFKISVQQGLEGVFNSINGYNVIFTTLIVSLGVLLIIIRTKKGSIQN